MELWAEQTLLDRLLIASDGENVGMVDDLELSSDPQPILTAILCGPTALGPRIGGRVGAWWLAIGRRLRPTADPYPTRIPIQTVKTIDHRGITLDVTAEELGRSRLHSWTLDKIIRRLPGGLR
jgi:sporulation protein YlmC with PRC-barrel domain